MEDLGGSINVIPYSLFKSLQLTNLKETSMMVEMVDMTKKTPMGIVENVLVKTDKFVFPSDFVIVDRPGIGKDKDNERRSVTDNDMVFADFLQVRYENQKIDDTTRERRYDEVSFSLGWKYEELHLTWTHFGKKQTRIQLYTRIGDENAYSATWKAFGGNTRDLGLILEETGQDCKWTQRRHKESIIEGGDGVRKAYNVV
ncbi:hypothetical protein Tco_1410917 [Tanacetum coccineum]